MKQHKASRKNGSNRQAPRTGATRKATGRKAASPVVASKKAKSPKPAARKRAPGPLVLPADCVIASVDSLRSALIACVGTETAVTLDAARVERIDTASLQVLAAFTRDRRAAGLAVEWSAVPALVSDAAGLLNLSATLGLTAPADGTVSA